jgi:hypothetical protein
MLRKEYIIHFYALPLYVPMYGLRYDELRQPFIASPINPQMSVRKQNLTQGKMIQTISSETNNYR